MVPPAGGPPGIRRSGAGWGRNRRLYGLAILLPVVALLSVVVVGPASAATSVLPGSSSKFESGDGNMTLDTSGDTDWNCFVGKTGFQPGTAPAGCLRTSGATQATADASGETKLTSGTKFDDPCVTFTTSNTPPKDDFTNIAEFSDTSATGDTYLYAAAIRSTANGNASGNVEFDQQTNGCRTAGDKLLAYDFLNGGTALSFNVLTWITTGTCDVGSATAPCWGVPQPVSGTLFNGESNQSAIATGGNGISGEALAINQFLEFGVNLTQTLGLTGCKSFPQNVFESRSSGSSFSSNPEDIEVQTRVIQTCGEVTIIKQTDPRGQNQLFTFTSGSTATSKLVANSAAGGVTCPAATTAGIQADGSFCLNDTGNAGKLLGSTLGVDNSAGNTIDESSVPRGTYGVTEGAEPTGYVFESVTCTADTASGSTQSVSGETATIGLQAGGHVTCLYINEKQFTPSLTTAAGTSTSASSTSASNCPAITAGTKLPIGTNVCDTATMTGSSGTGVAGTVTYTLYTGTGCDPTTKAPNGTAVFTSTEPVGSTGTIPNSATTVVSTAGDYQWQAVFTSTNNRNLSAASACASELFTVGPNSPTLATTAGTGTGVTPSGSTPDSHSDTGCAAFSGSLSIGTNVCDTATLSMFATPVMGTVTYTLYYAGVTGTTPNTNSCSSAGTPGGSTVFTDVQTAGSAGTMPNSADFAIANAGNYQWQAVFTSTNGQNKNATSACGTEQLAVGPQKPTLTTAAGTGGATPSATSDTSCTALTGAALAIGTNVCDTASLTGTAPPVAGTVTYKLYYAGTSGTTVNPNSCSGGTPNGTVVFTDVETVGSTGTVKNSADFTITNAGNYQWQAVFTSSNAQNSGATSACSTEQFVVGPNSPTLTTAAGTGSGVFPTGSTPDGHSDGSCAALSATLAINTNVCDTATLSSAAAPVAGTVTYTLYYAGVVGITPNANTCGGGTPGGTVVFTDQQTVGSGGAVPNSADFTVASAGNYQWQAVFASTNAQNNGATSTCGTEPFTVAPNSPTLATSAGTGSGVLPSGTTPDANSDASCTALTGTLTINTNVCDTATLNGAATPVAGTVTYTLYYAGVSGTTPASNSCGATGTPNGSVVFSDVQTIGTSGSIPNSADFKAANAGNYQWQAVFTTTNAQNNAAASTCGTEPFTVGPNSPTVTTTVGLGSGVFPSGATPDTNSDPSCAAFTGSLKINDNACDTAVLNGAATPAAGTVTYNLYYAGAAGNTPKANTCSPGGTPNGTLQFSDEQTVASSGIVPNSTDFTVTSAGNYQWQVSFTTTNAQNLSAISTCLTEPFTVAPNTPSMTTAQDLLPNDSANLTGATSTATGMVTFNLYNPTNTTCTGTGDYHEVVTVSGSNIYKTTNTTDTTDVMAAAAAGGPISSVGEWRWKVVYSGDLNNTPFTEACGIQHFIIANG